MSKKKNKYKNYYSLSQTEIYSDVATDDSKLTFEDLQQYIGLRKQTTIKNDTIVNSRMGLFYKQRKGKIREFEMYDRNNKLLGVCARIPLDDVWKKVLRYEGDPTFTKPSASASDNDLVKKYGIKRDQWEKAKTTLANYVQRNNLTFFRDGRFDTKAELPVLVQDVWQISELEFLQLFLEKSECIVALLNAAIKADIAETKALEKRWKKIKRYGYKVDLTAQDCAVFNMHNAEILMRHGAHCLNDIRKFSILDIKNMFLTCSISQLPEQINAVFKEDYARRLDVRLKVWPMILGLMSMAATFLIGLIYQYTLLKERLMTMVIIGLLFVWAITVSLVIYGAVRAKRRRRTKRPDYYYFSKKFNRAFVIFVLLSVSTLTSTTVFYERYDGYNGTVYYRNLRDGTISVAGLFDSDITKLTIPTSVDGKTVTKIADIAFVDSKLESVTMPQAITEVGRSAFKNNKELVSVKFSNNLESIPKNAFKNCENLTTIECDNGFKSIQSIGDGAFENCTSIEAVSFPNVETIGSNAFGGCEMLSSIDVFNSVQTIGDGAFNHCAVISVEIPATVTSIGRDVFGGCELDSLTLPFLGGNADTPKTLGYFCNKVTNLTVLDSTVICDNAFAHNTDLKTVVLQGRGEVTLGKGAFNGCTNLIEVTLPSGVTQIPDKLFGECSALTKVNGLNRVTEVGYKAFYNCSKLEFTNNLSSLRVIGNEAFSGCDKLTSADLSKVEQLGSNAFAMSGLRNVTFGSQMTTVPAGAFRDCIYLESITGYSHVEKIEKEAFSGCKRLKEITISSSIKVIENKAFANTAFTEFVIPNTVEELGRGVFDGCRKLQSLTLPFIGKTLNTSNKYSFNYVMSNSEYTDVEVVVTVTQMDTIYSKNFRDCKDVVGVIFTQQLTRIEKGAFYGASKLRGIDLYGITVIEADTFNGCSSLEMVANADWVTEVGANAFNGCSRLEEIDLPLVVTIKDRAFKDCSSLEGFTVPNTLQVIGKEVFANCKRLNNVVVSQTVENIGKGVFNDCSSLHNVTLPYLGSSANKPQNYWYFFNSGSDVRNLTVLNSERIGKKAFSGANSLETVNLYGSDVTEIGAYAFENCSSLAGVIMPNGIVSYPDGLFKNCYSLKTVSGFANVTEVGNQAFYGCNKFNDETQLVNLQIIGNQAFYDCYSLQSIRLNDITKLGNGAFENCSRLVSVYIGDNLDVIPSKAFYKCEGLTDVSGYANVTRIERESFRLCTSLRRFEFVDGIKYIGNFAFADNTSMRSLEVPDSVETMGRGIIEGCDKLSKIVIPFIGRSRATGWWYTFNYVKPDSADAVFFSVELTDMEHVYRNSFKNAQKMNCVVLSDNTTQIDAGAFRSTNIWQITLPKTITKINDNVFKNCKELTTIVNVDQIVELGARTFNNCTLLNSVNFPNVESTGKCCFEGCSSLTSVSLPKLKEISDSMFSTCSSLSNIELPKNITVIGPHAFRNCTSLESVTIPDSVEEIRNDAFRNSGLRSVSFGKGLTKLGDRAFKECTRLKSVALNSGLKQLGNNVFESCYNLETAMLSSSLESIGRNCFYSCTSLKYLQVPYIGSSVNKTKRISYFVNDLNGYIEHSDLIVVVTDATKIGYKAFANCTYLTGVVFNKEITEMDARIFDGCTNLKYVYMPDELAEFKDLIPSGVQSGGNLLPSLPTLK